jgi:ribosome biogenesis SPOUT family RNA methylase Rps3
LGEVDASGGAVPFYLDVEDIFEWSFILYLEVFTKIGDEVVNGVAVPDDEVIYDERKDNGVTCSCYYCVTQKDTNVCLELSEPK